MRICVFDTETTSLEKPFCYNVGYIIVDTDTAEILIKKDFVIEQIWHNLPLFNSAYYAEKRPIYVNRMRGRVCKLNKFGYVCREMARDFSDFDVVCAYAYNSDFDEKVFSFNCDWYKCSNPFDTIPVYDIRGVFHHTIAFTNDYQNFCETYSFFTESGNYSTTAETAYRYISGNTNFDEEHTALADSLIEWKILKSCIEVNGAEYDKTYKAYKSVPRKILRKLTIVDKTSETEHLFYYNKKTTRGNKIFLSIEES